MIYQPSASGQVEAAASNHPLAPDGLPMWRPITGCSFVRSSSGANGTGDDRPSPGPEPLTPPLLVVLTMLAVAALVHLSSLVHLPPRVWGPLTLGLGIGFGWAWRPYIRSALRRAGQPNYPYERHPDWPAAPPTLVAATLDAPLILAQLFLKGASPLDLALLFLLFAVLFGRTWWICLQSARRRVPRR